MSNKIGNDYIDNAINELVAVLGIKEKISPIPLFYDLQKGDVEECIKKIATCLGLPIKINLSYVTGYENQGTFGKNFTVGGNSTGERFESTKIVETGGEERGTQGISAQVLIPEDLPFYGSSRLNGYPIQIKISKSCLDYHKTFITMISHELSHVLLKSIASKEAHNDYYADLTSLLLGFSDLVWDGRKTSNTTSKSDFLTTTYTTQTGSYGYLNDEQFNYAYEKINKILDDNVSKKELLLTKIRDFENKHKLYGKYVSLFKESLAPIKSGKKIIKTDNDKITALSNPTMLEDADLFNNKNKDRVAKLYKYYYGLAHYTKHNVDILNKNTENTSTFIRELKDKITLMRKNIKILAGYNNIFNKLKINIRYFGIGINVS